MGGGEHYQECTFEGYGPDGVAIFIECTTDNNNRTVSALRSYFNKFGGSLGKEGCLQFLFERKGVFLLEALLEALQGLQEEEDFTLAMIDAGAEDVEFGDMEVTVTCNVENFHDIQKALATLDIAPKEAGLYRIPTTTKKLDPPLFERFIKLIEFIEDDDDVQKVYHNVEYSSKGYPS